MAAFVRLAVRYGVHCIAALAVCASCSSCSGDTQQPVTAVPQGDGRVGPPTITRAVAGATQQALVRTRVPIAPRMIVTDADGDPVSGVDVQFLVREGFGQITEERVQTGADGTAAVGSWQLGPVRGRNVLVAEVAGLAPVEFTAEGLPGVEGSMVIHDGDVQYALVGQAVAIAPAVLVRDQGDRPVVGRVVSFRIGSGGGSVGGATATTDDQGVARAAWTLGGTPGDNTVVAETASLPQLTFRAVGVSDQDPALQRDTILSGLDVPWDIAFAPDNTMLVSFRAGGVRVLRPGATVLQPLLSAPTDLDAQSQSGMLGIALDPNFTQNRLLYVYMSSRRSGAVDNRVRRFAVGQD